MFSASVLLKIKIGYICSFAFSDGFALYANSELRTKGTQEKLIQFLHHLLNVQTNLSAPNEFRITYASFLLRQYLV